MRRYAVYGGSFDPIHCGHGSMIERAIGLGYEVIVVPAYRHAFGKQSAPFEHRLRMCELALHDWGFQEQVRVYQIERTLAQGRHTPVYTYDVLCALHEKLGSPPCLLVGPDITAEWERWYRHEEIDRDFGRLCLPMTHTIRSTVIRQRLSRGDAPETLCDVLSASVIAYIRTEGLYR
jgi:nicotinate-nucleotide adenylyltransferase